ncbi:MAG TPA: hypothetical protein VH583_09555 [Vicinamibacterales bacterium]|jgi:hypothetical protein
MAGAQEPFDVDDGERRVMAPTVIQPSADSARKAGRERLGVIALAVGVVGVIAVYLALNASGGSADRDRGLLPYQALAHTLPAPDQRMHAAIRQGMLAAEGVRARSGMWPDIPALTANGVSPFTGADGYDWSFLQQGAIVNYFGRPKDASQPAWLLEIQEPEPGMPPDPAPSDDEHHRLGDGTVLHVYVWTHRFGGQVPVTFVRQPQNAGWTQVFTTAPDPVFYNRR